MLVIGAIGICSVIYFAFVLKDSVATLGELYTEGEKKQLILEEISTSIANFRAVSLRHLASESAMTMNFLNTELEQVKQNLQSQTELTFFKDSKHHAMIDDKRQAYSIALKQYFEKIDQAIQLSSDFEKESAFELLINAEYEYLPIINEILKFLKIHGHQDAASSRTILVSAAKDNLIVTLAAGIICGSLILIIVFFVTRSITRRLSKLLNWSHQVSSGNLSAALTSDSNDEVGLLTSAMVNMAQNIQRAHGDLAKAKLDAENVADTLRLYANAFEKSGEAIIISDKQNRIINVNSAFINQTGYSREEMLGKDPNILGSGKTPIATYEDMWASLEKDSFWQGELWDKKKSGQIYPKWVAITAIRDQSNQVMFYIASFTDISDRKEAEARIEQLAHQDILTGLSNRYSLDDRLVQSLTIAQRDQTQLGVFFIDLDRFKYINDSLGHHIGDRLLVEVAQRLKACVRESDIVARIGGDEFVVVLTGLKEISHVVNIAETILREISKAYEIDDHKLNTSPSIGISIYPNDGDCADKLLKNADTAMYHAKEQGRNNYYFFTESMRTNALERIKIERELNIAIHSNQLELHYQPQINTIDNSIHSMEALIRWNHPIQGLIPPDRFIPIAEETGLILEVGQWVINEACRQLNEWKNNGKTCHKLAVNLSVRQLQSEELVDDIILIMEKHQIQGSELELEITETVTMNEPELAEQQMFILRGLGISLAIDDFGTGYSSLAYLKRLPIQTLKLDKSFVRDIENDQNDAEICMATVALAHNLGLKVVAEGVETEAQRDFLVKLNCDYLQGYLFSKPLSAREISLII